MKSFVTNHTNQRKRCISLLILRFYVSMAFLRGFFLFFAPSFLIIYYFFNFSIFFKSTSDHKSTTSHATIRFLVLLRICLVKYCYPPLKAALMPHDILGLLEMVFEKISLSCAVRSCHIYKNI